MVSAKGCLRTWIDFFSVLNVVSCCHFESLLSSILFHISTVSEKLMNKKKHIEGAIYWPILEFCRYNSNQNPVRVAVFSFESLGFQDSVSTSHIAPVVLRSRWRYHAMVSDANMDSNPAPNSSKHWELGHKAGNNQIQKICLYWLCTSAYYVSIVGLYM